MFDSTAYDVEPRRKFRASDAAHFVLTGILLLCSGHLLLAGPSCEKYDTWNTFLFFGLLIWMVYLLLTLVVQFTNKVTRIFLSYLDYIFLAFMIVMAVWAWFWLDVNHADTSCAQRWPFWVMVFRCLAVIAAFCILASLIMSCLRRINAGTKSNDEIILSNIEGEYDQLDQSAL
jgi:carbon starvation protein CstA